MTTKKYNKSLKNGSNSLKEYNVICDLFQKKGVKHTRFACLVDVIIKRSISKFRYPLEYQVKIKLTLQLPCETTIIFHDFSYKMATVSMSQLHRGLKLCPYSKPLLQGLFFRP